MRKMRILLIMAFIGAIISTSVLAMEPANVIETKDAPEQQTGIFKDKDEQLDKCEKDPIKRLEKKKELIQKEYKEGKITKEKAYEMNDRIDKHIAKIKEFNSLPLPQKKEKLSEKYKSRIEKEVLDGKITKEEGEKLLNEFNKKLENWDGKEFPEFMKKKCDKDCKERND